MAELDWLTRRPIAHRGLHDDARGIIENMSGAINAAVASGFSIEVDLQLTADGEAVVHHDDNLGRLNEAFQPWLGNPLKDSSDLPYSDDTYIGIKDAGVFCLPEHPSTKHSASSATTYSMRIAFTDPLHRIELA